MAWRPADAGTTAGLRGHQHGDHSLISDHYTFYFIINKPRRPTNPPKQAHCSGPVEVDGRELRFINY